MSMTKEQLIITGVEIEDQTLQTSTSEDSIETTGVVEYGDGKLFRFKQTTVEAMITEK